MLDAPEEINDERNLGETHDPRRPRNGMVPLKARQSPNGVFIRQVPPLPAVIPTAMHSCHSLQEHRKKNQIHADERWPEVYFPPEITHLSPGRLREPVINACEQSEKRARCNDVMEMGDDIIGVVQVEIRGIKSKWNTGKPSDPKHRQKRRGEKHRHGEPDRTAPK